jgi:AcrR family transcriptional regulator
MDFKRARNKNNKAKRWNEIIHSAIHLFEKKSYAEITIKDIAKDTSFTRANIYKYISTKEEIFLEIIIRDSGKWINDLQKKTINNMEIDDFLELWCKTTYKHKRLIQLFTLLPFVIEKNVSLEKLAVFKSKFFKNLEPMHYIIKQAFPNLKQDDKISFVQAQYYFSVGILPVADPDDIQRKALELSGADYVVPDFYNELYNHLKIYLMGLLNNKPN